jgi:hypothetical protein
MIVPLDQGRARGESAMPAADGAGGRVVRLWQSCPQPLEVTEYDRQNVYLYGHLLEAESDGISLRAMARAYFGIDAERHRDRALRVVGSHLARAHWLKDNVVAFIDW